MQDLSGEGQGGWLTEAERAATPKAVREGPDREGNLHHEGIMKERTYGIILGILNLVLLVACGILFLGQDRNAPEILLPQGGIVYAEEAGTEGLFEGVTAFDEEDGELTGSLVIEKIVTNEGKESATITYGVADRAGNVGKATCTVAMIAREEPELTEEEEEDPEEVLEETGEDPEASSEEEESPEAEEEAEARDDREETPDSSEEPEEEASSEEEERSGEEEESTEARSASTAGGNAARSQTVEAGPDTEKPTMTFQTREVKVKAGSTPAWVEVLEGLHDDKDDYGTLLKTLKIQGEYNKDKAGTYPVTLTVTDSDGNESNAYPLKIIVEAWNP